MLTLLLIPYRRGERWAYRAIPCLALTVLVPTAYHCLALAVMTGAPTPWQFPLLSIGLVLLAWSLSRGGPADRKARVGHGKDSDKKHSHD